MKYRLYFIYILVIIFPLLSVTATAEEVTPIPIKGCELGVEFVAQPASSWVGGTTYEYISEDYKQSYSLSILIPYENEFLLDSDGDLLSEKELLEFYVQEALSPYNKHDISEFNSISKKDTQKFFQVSSGNIETNYGISTFVVDDKLVLIRAYHIMNKSTSLAHSMVSLQRLRTNLDDIESNCIY